MNKRMITMSLVCMILLCFITPAVAEVTWSGDVIPTDPTTWRGGSDGTHGYIGKTSDGTLSITNDSDVVDNYGIIGYESGATGEVTVDGIGSTWTNMGLCLGGFYGGGGNGVLNITSGGAVSNVHGYIGFWGGTGEVTVDGIGSIWTASGDLSIGIFGSGVLNITSGGAVSSSEGSIGLYATGEATVDGIGSTWTNSENLNVGENGSGILNITDDGLVSVAGTLMIDFNTDGDSFINMVSGGMLALYDVADASASLSTFLGLIDGTDAIRYWDYALGDWVDIAGGTMGEDYTLSYITTPGDDLLGYTVLTVLEVVLLDGDANRDGVISAGDYASVQANFGSMGIAGIHGDANGDGVVSAGDYASVQMTFGNVALPAEISTTPEPATLSLLVMGGVAMLRRRRS